jgi:hypothetical protein
MLPLLDAVFAMPWYSWILAVVLSFATLEKLLGTNKHKSEPPFIPTPVPYLGHLFGVIFGQAEYYARIR